jgi:hypothetical protein
MLKCLYVKIFAYFVLVKKRVYFLQMIIFQKLKIEKQLKRPENKIRINYSPTFFILVRAARLSGWKNFIIFN